jgi:hypothetical protein
MLESIEIKWDLLGAKLAKLTDEEQSKFFKGFAHELDTYESDFMVQMQMFYVKDKLNDNEKAILENALTCLWYEEK